MRTVWREGEIGHCTLDGAEVVRPSLCEREAAQVAVAEQDHQVRAVWREGDAKDGRGMFGEAP